MAAVGERPVTQARPGGTRARRHLRLIAAIFVAVGLVAALIVGGRAFVASDRGRALIVRALPLYAPKSGLRVAAGRIEGNVFGRLRVHDLTLADPAGVFARVPRLDLDWRPWTLLERRLTVRSADAAEMVVLRRPHLRPSADQRILPDIDIVVGRLRIGRLDLAAAVTGVPETLTLAGGGEAVRGRARVTLAATASGGDLVRLKLDAAPDADRFDVAGTVAAPTRGTLARLLGLPAALEVKVAGVGTYRAWHGTAVAQLGARPLAQLALTETQGRLLVAGTVAPAPLLDGVAARATTGGVRLRAEGRLSGRVLTAQVDAASPALHATATGTADFGHEVLSGIRVVARAQQPSALLSRLSGRDLVLEARIAGTFATPVVDYALTSPQLAWGPTSFTGVRAAGHVVVRAPLVVPVDASAASVGGAGADAAAILARLRLSGPITVAHRTFLAPALAATSAGATGTASLRLTFDGDYAIGFTGTLPHRALGDLGAADIGVRLQAVPAAAGTRVTGTVRAVATRVEFGAVPHDPCRPAGGHVRHRRRARPVDALHRPPAGLPGPDASGHGDPRCRRRRPPRHARPVA